MIVVPSSLHPATFGSFFSQKSITKKAFEGKLSANKRLTALYSRQFTIAQLLSFKRHHRQTTLLLLYHGSKCNNATPVHRMCSTEFGYRAEWLRFFGSGVIGKFFTTICTDFRIVTVRQNDCDIRRSFEKQTRRWLARVKRLFATTYLFHFHF